MMKAINFKFPRLAFFFMALTFVFTSCQKDPELPVPEPGITESNEEIELNENITEDQYLALMQEMEDAEAGQLENGRAAAYAFVGQYELTYSDLVRLNIGGAVYNHTTQEWLSGSAAGNAQLSPDLFAQLNAQASHHIEVRIHSSWFFLRRIDIVLLDKGNQMISGLYNANNGTFLFLGAGASGGTQVGNTSCGYVTLGMLTGRLANGKATIDDGQLSYGFIAGCSPVIVAASLTFGYEGVRIN